MNITVNQNVIKTLRDAGFYPDTMMTALTALFALQEKEITLLDSLDDNNGSKRAIIVYYDLVRKGLWKETPEENQLFHPTKAGVELYQKLKHDMDDTGVPVEKMDVETWFPSWFNLWPKGVKTMGKLIRSDEKGCLKKMKAFVKDYPQYTPQTIINATALYLREREEEQWRGVRCATYFIHHKESFGFGK